MKRIHIIAISVLIGFIAGCAVPAHASNGSCRSLEFTTAAAQYHGEEIRTDKEVLPVNETLCDLGNGKARLSWTVGGVDMEETLNHPADGVYMSVATPANSDKITTIIVYHFSNDGSFNYTRSVNGTSPIKGQDGKPINFNSVSMAVGSWYF